MGQNYKTWLLNLGFKFKLNQPLLACWWPSCNIFFQILISQSSKRPKGMQIAGHGCLILTTRLSLTILA